MNTDMVDEVDSFLDRIEATLQSEPIGAPVTTHEVHDVVFRNETRWLRPVADRCAPDRVERGLSDLEAQQLLLVDYLGRDGRKRPVGRRASIRSIRPDPRSGLFKHSRIQTSPVASPTPPCRPRRLSPRRSARIGLGTPTRLIQRHRNRHTRCPSATAARTCCTPRTGSMTRTLSRSAVSYLLSSAPHGGERRDASRLSRLHSPTRTP